MSEENKDFTNDASNNDSSTNESIEITDADTVYFSEAPLDNEPNEKNEEPAPKKSKHHISIKTFAVALIAVILATVMLTYSICSAYFQKMYAEAYVDANTNSFINGNVTTSGVSELDVIAQLIKDNYYAEVDSEKLMEAAIEAYIAQTGDIYAAYYTQAEVEASAQESVGKSVGVGITVINSTVNYNGKEISVLKITNISKDSPAEKGGVMVGDYVYAVILDGQKITVDSLGYNDALDKLLGKEGTTVSFSLLRDENGELKEHTFELVREAIISQSVYWRIPEISENADKKIGVVKITTFDYTTPTQFKTAIEELKSKGCEKFVLDVRYNYGGYDNSIHAVLSYFLNEGDVYLRTKDKNGNIESETISVVSDFEGDYAGCNVIKEDIGRYKDLDCVIVCNEFTVSAAELFVATFKDYNLAKVVGATTFGKGKLQHTFYLKNYALFNYGVAGIDGAVRITTHEYYSAKSDSYDGIGIEPDEKVALREEAYEINIHDYKKLDPIDDQLLKAINILNG